MDITELLASLLNPNGSQQAILGAPAATAVGDHANPALLQAQMARFSQPPQVQQPQASQPVPQQAAQPQGALQAPQGQPMAQPAPQAAPAPSVGGVGDFLANLFAPKQAGKNRTIGWLQEQGLDPGTATILASDKGALRSYLLQRSKGAGPTEFDQRAAAAKQYGLDPSTPEGRNFVLTGSVDKPSNDKPTSDIQNFNFAVQNGYKGTFEQWTKDNKSGVTVNLPGSPNIGTIPPGYAAKQDPQGNWSMQPVAGGPEDPTKTNAAKADNAATASDVITSAANKIRSLAHNPTATGMTGALYGAFANTDAAEVNRQVEVLKSNAKVENLNAMRAASKTGGALGAVSDKESTMLSDKAGALDPKSPYFQAQLDDYTRTLLRIVHGKDAGDKIFEATRKDEAPPPPELAPYSQQQPAGQGSIYSPVEPAAAATMPPQQQGQPSPERFGYPPAGQAPLGGVVDWTEYFKKKAP